MMRRRASIWGLVFLLSTVVSSLFLPSPPGQARAVPAPAPQELGEEPGKPDMRVITKEMAISFEEPELIFDERGRIKALSLPGCELIAISGLPLLPVKVLTFKFDIRTEEVDVEVELGEIEELPLRHELKPAPSPMPISRAGRPCRPQADRRPSVPGPLPERWYEYEVHHGIDISDLTRKTFVFVRIYPIRLDAIEKKVLFLRGARVVVEVSGEPLKRAAEGSEVSMLIITSEELLPAAEFLASYKNSSGIPTIIRTVEWITGNYDGRDEQEKIRNCVKDVVERFGIVFLLILGDHDVVPTRLVYIPDGAYDEDDANDGTLVETDLYYADLDLDWNDNDDGLWGDLNNDDVDGFPDVMVGRLPASTLNEAWTLVGKIQVYESTSYNAPWLRKALFIGTDLFTGTGYEGPEGEILKDHIDDNYVRFGTEVIKLYETEGTLSSSAVINTINDGCGFVNFAGHGAPDRWSLGSAGSFTPAHVSALSNGDKLCFVCTAACLTSRFSDRDCIGERFMLKSNGGAIAYFGSTRVAWMCGGSYAPSSLSGRMDAFFAEAYFYKQMPTPGSIWAYAIQSYINRFSIRALVEGHYLHWKTVAEYGSPFGDPSLYLWGRQGACQLQVVCYDADGETPVEGVEVQLDFLGVFRFSGTTDETGGVAFENLPPGRYDLRAMYMGVVVAEEEISVPSDKPVRLNCSLYDVVITCLDAGNETLRGALVWLYRGSSLVANGTTDWRGRLRLEDLPATTYTIHVNWTEHMVERRVCSSIVTLKHDEQSIRLRCALYDVVIEVLDALNRPVEGAVVKLYMNRTLAGASGRSWELLDTLTTSPDGRVEVEDLFKGLYRIVVSAELAEPKEVVLTVSKPGVVITVYIGRFLSPRELYSAIGAGALVIVAAVGYVLYHRVSRRLPVYPSKGG